MRKLVLCAAVALVCLLGIRSSSWAQEDPPQAVKASPDKDHMDNSNGSFAQSIAIEVPPFRGLEPSLSLDYDSGRGNGFLGVGWRLRGLSSVERSSPRFGAPRFDDAVDVFLLDGDELVACSALPNAAAVPGCAAGGTHATRTESYLRIVRDTVNNRWEVTNREGTKLTYQVVATWGTYNAADPNAVKRATNYRWLLASVADVHGNTVLYNYGCDGVPDCYIDTITYNGNSARFYRETRTDTLPYGTGAGLGAINYRLKFIEIKVGAQLVRAYALAYGTGIGTQRSRLVSVQQFGRDAVVDSATGVVTGGLSLPPISVRLTDGTGSFFQSDWLGTQSQGSAPKAGQFQVVDFNGDARADMANGGARDNSVGCSLNFWLSSGSAFTFTNWAAAGCSGAGLTGSRLFGDYNGDGKTDYSVVPAQTGSTAVYLSTGTGFVLQTWPQIGPQLPTPATTTHEFTGDFNGDGRSDIAVEDLDLAPTCGIFVKLAGVSQFTGQVWPVTPGCPAVDRQNAQMGDFNGDGKTDFLWREYVSANMIAELYISTGSSFVKYDWPGVSNARQTYESWHLGDVNGDGMTDLIEVWYGDGTGLAHADPYLSTGTGFIKYSGLTISGFQFDVKQAWSVGDYNGDGRADLSNGGNVVLSTGTSFTNPITWYSSDLTRPRVGDFSGDGKDDFANIAQGTRTTCSGPPKDQTCTTSTIYKLGTVVRVSQGSVPDLLTGVMNSLGGTKDITYAASATFANNNLPFVVQTVSSVMADDGRGTVSTTSYTYSGGSWNPTERRFLGFQKVTATLPANAGETQRPKVETTYLQTVACAGAVQTVKQMDSAGTVLRQTDEVYADNSTTLPYTCLNTETTSTVKEGASNKSAKVSRTFDTYANVVTLTRHGNLAVSGDETISEAVYQPNTSAYIVSLPSRLRVHAGTTTAGAKLQESYSTMTAPRLPPRRRSKATSRRPNPGSTPPAASSPAAPPTTAPATS